MSRVRLNPEAVFRDLGYEPHEGQRLVHESLAPRRVLACGVRWGKSLCGAMEAIVAALQPKERSMGWVVGPTYDLADKIFREIVYIVAARLRHRIVTLKEHEKRLVLLNMAGGRSEIRAKSADNPTSLLGEALDWVILDEAARLKPAIWESFISQRLIDRKGWALMISTPKGKGWFYEAFRRGQGHDDAFESWNSPSWLNPHLDAALIEEERDRLPERVFRQEFGGEFLEGSGQVFRNVRERALGAAAVPVPGARYYAGLDLAKVHDYTVLVILNAEREVVYWDRFHRLDWNTQIQRVQVATDRYNRAVITCDATGLGDPLLEMLKRAGCRAEAYPFTAKSKAALVDALAMALEQGQIRLPRPELWPELIDELEGFEYDVTDAGNVRTSAPAGMHDDCVMALGLALWPVRTCKPKYRSVWVPFEEVFR